MREVLDIVGAKLFREGVEIGELALIIFLVLVAKKFRSYKLIATTNKKRSLSRSYKYDVEDGFLLRKSFALTNCSRLRTKSVR